MTATGSVDDVTGVATTVNVQPGRPTDREFRSVVLDFGGRSIQAVLRCTFEIAPGKRMHICNHLRRITRSQKLPANKKLESVRARLDRVSAEGDVPRNADEFRLRKSFECVSFVRCK